MSGVKEVYVSVPQSRIRQMEEATRAAQETARQALAREQNSRNALNSAQNRNSELTNSLSAQIRGLSEEVQQMARAQNQRLIALANQHNQELTRQASAYSQQMSKQRADFERTIGRVREEAAKQRSQDRAEFQAQVSTLQKQREKDRKDLTAQIARESAAINAQLEKDRATMRAQLEQNRKELQQSIDEVQSRITRKEKAHSRIAQFWIEQAQAYFNDIEQYRHELFAPAQLARLRTQLDQTMQDVKNETYEAAIASARSIFNNAAELKDRIIHQEIEWSDYFGMLQIVLADVKSNYNYYQSMRIIVPTDEGEEQIDARVDYWTDGRLTDVGAAIAAIDAKVVDADNITTSELISLREQLMELNRQMDDIREESIQALIASQVRNEVASSIADSLMDAGWVCDGAAYEGNEESEAVHVKLRDNIGNEIVAIISPTKTGNGYGNNLEVNFFDPYENDLTMRGIRVASISESLREIGLDVGQPITREGYEVRPSDNDAIRDIEATARKPVARKITTKQA